MSPSPTLLARAVAVASLVTIALGVIAQGGLLSSLLDPADPGGAAQAITENQGTYRLALTLLTIEMLVQAVMFGLWFALMRTISPVLATVAAVLGVVGVALKMGARTGLLLPLVHGEFSADTLGDLDADTVALALLANDIGAGLGVMFLGAATLTFAIAMYRTRVVPRAVSGVVAVSAAGWLIFAEPVLGPDLFLPISLLGLVGAIVLAVRFLGWGVRDEVWQQPS